VPHSLSDVSDQDLAALMLKGLTAQFLLKRTYSVKSGDVILVHAAAGGMGLILCQWAKYIGAFCSELTVPITVAPIYLAH
jgi:NADPH2:quinone reductase